MRPRSVQRSNQSGSRKSSVSYGEGSLAAPDKGAVESNQENLQRTTAKRFMREKQIHSSKIAERAYLAWERAGRPEGRDREFWLRAEAELKSEQAI